MRKGAALRAPQQQTRPRHSAAAVHAMIACSSSSSHTGNCAESCRSMTGIIAMSVLVYNLDRVCAVWAVLHRCAAVLLALTRECAPLLFWSTQDRWSPAAGAFVASWSAALHTGHLRLPSAVLRHPCAWLPAAAFQWAATCRRTFCRAASGECSSRQATGRQWHVHMAAAAAACGWQATGVTHVP
jgi:hypothetical protein